MMDYCPPCWQNFANEIMKREHANENRGLSKEQLDKHLKEYSARYIRHSHVEFEDEFLLMLFIMRWS